MSGNHMCNNRYFKRKALQWPRSRVASTPLLVQEVMLLLQILQTRISPWYLFKLVPLRWSPYATRKAENIPLFKTKHNFFKNSFSPSAVIGWNNPDHNIQNVGSFSAFKNNILKFIRATPNNNENHRRIKLFIRVRVGLLRVGHLREHKLKHSFQDTLNPICSCGSDVESTSHYTLHCPIYNDKRHTLLSTIKNINCRFLDVTETIVLLMHTLIHTFLMQKLNLS